MPIITRHDRMTCARSARDLIPVVRLPRDLRGLAVRLDLRILPHCVVGGDVGALFGLVLRALLVRIQQQVQQMATMAPALMPEWKIVWNQSGKSL